MKVYIVKYMWGIAHVLREIVEVLQVLQVHRQTNI